MTTAHRIQRWPDSQPAAFRHEALLYAGRDEFVSATASFVRDGVAAGEPTLVVVDADKIDLLRDAVGEHETVRYADMAEVGANPVRIIPAWRDFVSEHADNGQRLRGIGEPVWAERSPAELVECQRHESLLNLAFADAPAWWLLCPYDADTLAPDVVEEARRTHPFLWADGTHTDSPAYEGLPAGTDPFDHDLPAAPPTCAELPFSSASLRDVRTFVLGHARRAGLGPERTEDVLLAVNELATNSLRHAGGKGRVRIWEDADGLVCEVCDDGRVGDPLAGRAFPHVEDRGGRGLWLVNQVSDLVQLRSSTAGTVVRVHIRR